MGFHDNVRFDKAFPEYSIAEGATFTTRNLRADEGEFAVTAEGTLVEHLYRYEIASKFNISIVRLPLGKRVHVGDKVLDYHGDLLLSDTNSDGPDRELVARFTHGRLEWVRPLNGYPAESRDLLLEQGAR